MSPWVTRQDAGLAAPRHGWRVAATHGFKPAFGHTEPKRGAECWGKSPFGYFWGSFPKVTRRKGGTLSSRYRSNGYLLDPTSWSPVRPPSGASPLPHLAAFTLLKNQLGVNRWPIAAPFFYVLRAASAALRTAWGTCGVRRAVIDVTGDVEQITRFVSHQQQVDLDFLDNDFQRDQQANSRGNDQPVVIRQRD